MKFEKIVLDDTKGKEVRYLEVKSRILASKSWWIKKYDIDPEENLA